MASLTAAERWSFDHHGFLLLRSIVPKADIARMLHLSSQWLPPAPAPLSGARASGDESQCPLDSTPPLPPPLIMSGSAAKPERPRWVNNVHYADAAFARAAVSPEVYIYNDDSAAVLAPRSHLFVPYTGQSGGGRAALTACGTVARCCESSPRSRASSQCSSTHR